MCVRRGHRGLLNQSIREQLDKHWKSQTFLTLVAIGFAIVALTGFWEYANGDHHEEVLQVGLWSFDDHEDGLGIVGYSCGDLGNSGSCVYARAAEILGMTVLCGGFMATLVAQITDFSVKKQVRFMQAGVLSNFVAGVFLASSYAAFATYSHSNWTNYIRVYDVTWYNTTQVWMLMNACIILAVAVVSGSATLQNVNKRLREGPVDDGEISYAQLNGAQPQVGEYVVPTGIQNNHGIQNNNQASTSYV